MQVNDKQRYLMITEAAYFLAERRGFEPGHEHEDWTAAERQVDEMLKVMAQQLALEQRIKSGEEAKLVRETGAAKSADRTTTSLGQSKSSPRGKKALVEGRQTTESNQAPAMQASLISEANEQSKPPQKTATGKTKVQPKAKSEAVNATPTKPKAATGGRKATTAKRSVAAGTVPSEVMPQPTSATGEQPEVKTKAPTNRTRRSTKAEQAEPMPMAAASQEESNSARKPRQKKAVTNIAAKGDGRRRSKTTAI